MDSRDFPKPLGCSAAATAMAPINRLLRLDRRKRLREALRGSPEGVWAYVWARQMAHAETELRTHGGVRYGDRVAAERLIRNYSRLCVMARAIRGH